MNDLATHPEISKGSERPGSRRTLIGLPIAILVVVSLAVYFNALFNGFIHDDIFQVVGNQWIREIRYVSKIFFANVWSFQGVQTSNYYRPLQHITYMGIYQVFGLRPWGFHLVNILIHAAVCVVAFLITSRLIKESNLSGANSSFLPFIAAMLFATHPIHTEAVTWVSGIVELSYTFFCLLSFLFYIRWVESNSSNRLYFLSLAAFLLACFFKEPALTLPGIFIAYDYGVRKKEIHPSLFLKSYVPFLLVGGFYFCMRIYSLKAFAPHKSHNELTTYQYFINIFPLFSQYLEKLLLPVNLNFFHVLHPISSILETKGILSLAVGVAFMALIYLSWEKNRTAFLGLIFVALPIIPVLYIPGVGENTFAERYLYLPSFGFVVLLVLFMGRYCMKKSKITIGIMLTMLVIIGLYSFGTIQRNSVWKDEMSLWSDVIKKAPEVAKIYPHAPLGEFLFKKGMIDEALVQFQVDLMLRPDSAEGHHNLGAGYQAKGLINKAIEQYKLALNLDPTFTNAHYNLGNVCENIGSTDKAINHFEAALRLRPNFGEVHNNLGVLYVKRGLLNKAIDHFEAAVRANPYNPAFHQNLERAYKDRDLRKYKRK